MRTSLAVAATIDAVSAWLQRYTENALDQSFEDGERTLILMPARPADAATPTVLAMQGCLVTKTADCRCQFQGPPLAAASFSLAALGPDTVQVEMAYGDDLETLLGAYIRELLSALSAQFPLRPPL